MWASPTHSSPLSLTLCSCLFHRRVRLRCRDVLMTFGPVSLNSFVAQTWRGRHTACNLCSSSCASTLASQSLSLSQLTSPSASFIFINLTYFFCVKLRRVAQRKLCDPCASLPLPATPLPAFCCFPFGRQCAALFWMPVPFPIPIPVPSSSTPAPYPFRVCPVPVAVPRRGKLKFKALLNSLGATLSP